MITDQITFGRYSSLALTDLQEEHFNEKVLEVVNVLNGLPTGASKEILKEVDRLISLNLSKVDTSLILLKSDSNNE